MATALLIGTNAWAQAGQIKIGETVYSSLNAAFAAAQTGDVIELTGNVQDATPAWLGTKDATDAKKSIVLDLKGHVYENTSTKSVAIALTHGTLEIKSTGGDGEVKTASATEELIRMYGTYEAIDAKNGTPFTQLIVREGVTLRSTKKNAISVDVLRPGQATLFGKADSDFGYACDFFYNHASGWGVANGVRVDIEGNIFAEKYGIKVNGCVRFVKDYVEENSTAFKAGYPNQRQANSAYTYAPKAAYTVDESAVAGNYSPYICIASTGRVKTADTKTEAVAAYSSGYARWFIKGYCGGNTGLYVKSGHVDVESAHIESTNPTYTVPSGKSSGIDAGGSAIVVESNASYSGNSSVAISGDTHVEAKSGYAIEEKVTTANTTEVEAVTINGGTLTGGEVGAMYIDDKTIADPDARVVVYGANVEGNVAIGSENDQLSELIPENTHITEVVVDGKTTIVVSEGNGPAVETSVIGADPFTAVKWQNALSTEETLTSDLTLTELEINEDYAQTLTIADGSKLIVGRAILGENAKIIVKPGAKLIITGVQGINANVADNIILESSATKQAILLFNPAVASNRHPKAAVKMHVDAGKEGSEYRWTRFALPIQAIDAVKRQNNYDTYIYGWNYTANAGQGDWELVANVKNDLKPWAGYTLTYENEGEQVYTFEGNLAGNEDAALNFVHRGYNYFGNSYSSYIDAKTLVQNLPADIDATVYLWDAVNQIYQPTSMSALIDNPKMLDYEWQKDIAPMTTFILRLMDLDNASADVNYANAIWSNPRHGNAGGSSSAPKHAPAMRNEDAFISMVVTAANGKSDCIRLLESAEYTDAYERGYDAAKFMNTNTVNLYASINGEKYSNVCTNSLDGKEISMQTMDDVNYTISFRNVEGNEYALLDKVANQVIAIEEDAIYEFAAQPNSTIEGRFEIVGRQNMPTAIENTEVKANVKGIYTIMGQYLGEDFEVLPAGVYVVNGVKVEK